MSNQADYADLEWREYATWCGAGVSAAPSGGRAWFAVWSASGAGGGNVRADCSNMYRAILDRANKVKAVMVEASERARRNGVYPGEMRDVRRRYSLDYDGW